MSHLEVFSRIAPSQEGFKSSVLSGRRSFLDYCTLFSDKYLFDKVGNRKLLNENYEMLVIKSELKELRDEIFYRKKSRGLDEEITRQNRK